MEAIEFGTETDGATVEVAIHTKKGIVFSITGHEGWGQNGGYDFDVKEAKILKKALDQFLMDQM